MQSSIKSVIFLSLFSIELISGLNKDCGSYNLTNLDLETYHFYFRPTHLEQTLYCVGYKRHLPPSSVSISLIRILYKLIRVDETDSTIQIFEKIYLEYKENTLDFSPLNGTKRLKFRSEYVSLFWNPDFDPHKSTMFQPMFDYVLLHLSGLVQISKTDQINKINCEMKYHWFPFDTQSCFHPIIIDEIEAIKYNEKNLFEESLIEQMWHPVWNVQLQKRTCQIPGKQCFPIEIVLQRKTSDHLLHTFVPSVMLSIASGTSLYIPQDYMPARMGLSVTTCLSMITLFVSAQ